MMKAMEGLIYEEILKKPNTKSGDPELTSGNWVTDNKYLEGVNHQSEIEPGPQHISNDGEVKGKRRRLSDLFRIVSRERLEGL